MSQRELHVASPMLHGEDVVALQQTLSRLGYHPGPVDGYYGPASFEAVKRFQAHEGLDVDGIVGPLTWAKLSGKPKPAPPHQPAPVPKPKRPVTVKPVSGDPGLLALREAVKHLGVKEHPAGTNANPFGPALGMPDRVPWCDEFVSYCLIVGAGYVQCDGFHGAGCYAKGCTYVPTTEAWLRATGQWVGRSQPQPGYIAIFNWDGGEPDHIGIVEKYLGGGQFLSCEGNTAVGNDSNGGEVMRRTRYLTQVDGFGHLISRPPRR